MARAPWGSIVFVFLLADAVSLYLFYDWLRDGGRGAAESAGLVLAYAFLAVVVGFWAIRAAGGLALMSAARRMTRNARPEAQLLNALLALVGGLLIAFPGLASDALGVALLVPPTRTLARWALARRMRTRTVPVSEVEVEYRIE